MTIETTFARKDRQLTLLCALSNRIGSCVSWLDAHCPECVMGRLFPLYWRIEAEIGRRWSFAYQGSLEEIEQAWEFPDEDWLSPFQKAIVRERILPLPLSMEIPS
jgi:hypothetical protein